MDFERILDVPFFHSSPHSIMLCKPYKSKKNKKLAFTLGIQTYQILTNDDEVCIPSLCNILLAVLDPGIHYKD